MHLFRCLLLLTAVLLAMTSGAAEAADDLPGIKAAVVTLRHDCHAETLGATSVTTTVKHTGCWAGSSTA